MSPPPTPTVLEEGADWIAVFKPAGLSVELTTDFAGRSLIAWARRQWPEARLVHRLDRPTQGLVIIARDAAGAARLSADLQARRWEKLYLARIPRPADPEGLLGRHRVHLKAKGQRAEVVRAGGKIADLEILGWAPAPSHSGQAHVLIRLLTGRFHQIRVTLAHLGHPLTGDDRYGGAPGEMYLAHVAACFARGAEAAPQWCLAQAALAAEAVAPSLRARLGALHASTSLR